MGWSATGVSDVIEDESSYQALSREWGHVYKLRQRTRITEVRGLTRSAALGYSTREVTFFTQTSGSYYFAHFTRTVKRRKADPSDGWKVTLTETWAALYRDGVWQCGAGEPRFTALNPEPMTS